MKNYNNKKKNTRKTKGNREEKGEKRTIAPLQRGENSSLQSNVLRA